MQRSWQAREWEVSAEDLGQRRRTTAFHEAGHAVIGIRNGFTLLTTTIVPSESYFGFCSWTGKASGGKSAIELYAAGAVAEDAFMASEQLSDDDTWKIHDDPWRMQQIARELVANYDDDAAYKDYVLPALEKVRRELQALPIRNQVHAVAHALLQSETLSGGDVRSIIESVAGGDEVSPR